MYSVNLCFIILQTAKRSDSDLVGRADGHKKVIFPDVEVSCATSGSGSVRLKPGDYVQVKVSRSLLR